jgi:hypothetical protein
MLHILPLQLPEIQTCQVKSGGKLWGSLLCNSFHDHVTVVFQKFKKFRYSFVFGKQPSTFQIIEESAW